VAAHAPADVDNLLNAAESMSLDDKVGYQI
jgi:hypothetical protein